MIVRHTEHLIESFAREIPNSHNWAALYLCHGMVKASATYTSSMVR